MLKEHFGSSSYSHQYDSPQIIEDQLTNNISLPNYEWQTLLSFDHWPTLFSFYNISYDNRYLTIMPSIYLPIISDNQHLDMTTKSSYHRVRSSRHFIRDYVFLYFIGHTSTITRCNNLKYE